MRDTSRPPRRLRSEGPSVRRRAARPDRGAGAPLRLVRDDDPVSTPPAPLEPSAAPADGGGGGVWREGDLAIRLTPPGVYWMGVLRARDDRPVCLAVNARGEGVTRTLRPGEDWREVVAALKRWLDEELLVEPLGGTR